jgi:hypothetical protein
MEHTGSCAAATVARARDRSGAMNNMLILRDGFVSWFDLEMGLRIINGFSLGKTGRKGGYIYYFHGYTEESGVRNKPAEGDVLIPGLTFPS